MGERYERPDWVRRVNAMAAATGGPDRVVPLSAGQLIDDAVGSTGLDDFGDLGDGDWEGRFRALVDAIGTAPLHVVGRLLTREELLRSLRTRLFMADARRRAPAIADEVIDQPIVVTGPARSGTTILFEILALDPGLRSPVAAEVMHPGLPATVSDAERLAMTECEQELWADVQPEFAAIHELRSDLPVECVTICAPSFAGNHWAMVLDDLGGWVPDVAADLAFHKAALQTCQHGRPPAQWLLKTPAYLMMIDDLLAAYPSARIIQTHRDPARTMPSTVSTTAMIRWLRYDDVDLDGLSQLIGAVFMDALATVARRRRDGTIPSVFGDVRYDRLVSDPVGAVEEAYAAIGRPLSDEHRRAIADYLEHKPQGKHGLHRYTAEEWGFSPAEVRAQLADYLEQFGIAEEG